MSTITRPITAEELFAMGDNGRCELINGEVVRMSPSGFSHGRVVGRLTRAIANFVEEHDLGEVVGAETGFTIRRKPDTVRAPDIGFVSKARLPDGDVPAFFPGHPDLAVEVVSPGDTVAEVTQKVDQWLDAGTTSVWVVNPTNRSVVIHRAGNTVIQYRVGDAITDEPTLPGFALKVAKVFSR